MNGVGRKLKDFKMLCKLGGSEGRTRNQISAPGTQVRGFLWTQGPRQSQVLPAWSGFCFLCLVHPCKNKAIEVVDITPRPASAQMEFSTLLLLQILIKALASQQWTHCLVKSKQFLAASQSPGGPPGLGHGAIGHTLALGSPPAPLLQPVELGRVKGNACFEPAGSHTEGPQGDDPLCCYEERPAQKSTLGLRPVPGGRPVRSRPVCTCLGLACDVTL